MIEMTGGKSERKKQRDQNSAGVDWRKNCVTEQEMEEATDQMWK